MPRLVASALLAAAALAAPDPSSAAPRRAVRSMLELRKDQVVSQGWDLSCGAAALSTLLTYEEKDPVSEAEVVAGLLRHADPERIRRQGGFTLLDLKRYATARGYAAAGYAELTVERLVGLGPAIVPTLVNGRPHFMVFRGRAGDRVLLADPAYGNRTMRRAELEAIWSPRVAFVLGRPGAPRPAAAAEARAAIVRGAAVRESARWVP